MKISMTREEEGNWIFRVYMGEVSLTHEPCGERVLVMDSFDFAAVAHNIEMHLDFDTDWMPVCPAAYIEGLR